MANRFSLAADITPTIDEGAAEREGQQLAQTLEQEVGDLGVGVDGGGVGGLGGARAGGAGVGGAAAGGALGRAASGAAAGGLAKVALGGAVGFGLLTGIQSLAGAAPALKQTNALFGEAMELFFRPFGTALSEVLRPFATEALTMAKNFNDVYQSDGLGVALLSLGGDVVETIGGGIANAIGETLTGQADGADLITLGVTSVAVTKLVTGASITSLLTGASITSLVSGASITSLVSGTSASALIGGVSASALIGGVSATAIIGGVALGALVGTAAIDNFITGTFKPDDLVDTSSTSQLKVSELVRGDGPDEPTTEEFFDRQGSIPNIFGPGRFPFDPTDPSGPDPTEPTGPDIGASQFRRIQQTVGDIGGTENRLDTAREQRIAERAAENVAAGQGVDDAIRNALRDLNANISELVAVIQGSNIADDLDPF